jgi:amphiphysin
MLQQHRTASGSSTPARAGSIASKAGLDRKTSSASSYGRTGAAAPPPYSAATSASTSSFASGKKAPPPPPPLKPKPGAPPKQFCTAIFDYEAQAEGDLSFSAGERIEIVERTDSADDWWTGKVNGRQGIFPGNYTQLD